MAILGLATMAVVPQLVPTEELRRAAAEAISGGTHLKAEMDGEPALRLLPTPRVVARKVKFPLAEGQSLDADAVVSRIDLWSLLLGKVVISDITLDSPTLVLTGRRRIPAGALVPFLAAAPRSPELHVVDGTIAWRAESGLTEELVSGISASIDTTLSGKGVILSARFDWRHETVDAGLTIDDIEAFLAGKATPSRLRVAADDAILRFSGTSGLAASLSAEGDLSADIDSLRNVLDWFGSVAPTNRGFGPFSFSSHLVLDKGDMSLTRTKVSLDGNRGEGGLLVKLTDGRPSIQGTFATDALNLHPYGRLRLTNGDGQEWSRSPIDLALLEHFDLDLRLSAGQVTAESAAGETTTFTTAAASAVLTDGRLVLALGQTNGWGGMLRGTATITPRWAGAGPNHLGAAVQIEAECTDIALERALNDLAGLHHFEGTGTLSFNLRGAGRSVLGIARTLSGSVKLASAGGYLLGFDVAQVLRRIERRPLSGGDDPRGGRTPYTALLAHATVSDGTATLDTMALEGKQVRLTMKGKVAVGARMLDLSGVASLIPAVDAGRTADDIDLPFVVQGPWTTPRIMADPLSLIERSGAAQPLLEAVKSHRGNAAMRPVMEKLIGPFETAPAISTTPAAVGAGAN